ncbi:MAG: hypothetical protein SGARI_001462 [Bacillariaceae sp.]
MLLQNIAEHFKQKTKDKKALQEELKQVLVFVKKLDEEVIVQSLLDSADVVFCTLSSAGSIQVERMKHVNDLIVDEASACTEAEMLIPLRTNPNKMLLLPATVMSKEAIAGGFARSLQERLMFSNNYEYTLLDTQYRMKPVISQWPLARFYNGRVKNGDNVENNRYGSEQSLLLGEKPYTWLQVTGQEHKDRNGSTFNEQEAEAVIGVILQFKEINRISDDWLANPDHLRIITFYKAQEDYIRFKLKQYGLSVTVSTVDAAQGCESDIVVLSFVRGTSGFIGFIKDMQRLNVALTRARFQLICVGNLKAIADLREVGGNFELIDMAKDALERCHVVSAPESLPPPPSLPKSTAAKSRKKKTKPKGRKGKAAGV